jgi:hypothetical protein
MKQHVRYGQSLRARTERTHILNYQEILTGSEITRIINFPVPNTPTMDGDLSTALVTVTHSLQVVVRGLKPFSRPVKIVVPLVVGGFSFMLFDQMLVRRSTETLPVYFQEESSGEIAIEEDLVVAANVTPIERAETHVDEIVQAKEVAKIGTIDEVDNEITELLPIRIDEDPLLEKVGTCDSALSGSANDLADLMHVKTDITVAVGNEAKVLLVVETESEKVANTEYEADKVPSSNDATQDATSSRSSPMAEPVKAETTSNVTAGKIIAKDKVPSGPASTEKSQRLEE